MMYVGTPVDCNGGDSVDALSVIETPPCVGFGRLAVMVGAGQTTLAEAVVADAYGPSGVVKGVYADPSVV